MKQVLLSVGYVGKDSLKLILGIKYFQKRIFRSTEKSLRHNHILNRVAHRGKWGRGVKFQKMGKTHLPKGTHC
jgi:hypothetical protein